MIAGFMTIMACKRDVGCKTPDFSGKYVISGVSSTSQRTGFDKLGYEATNYTDTILVETMGDPYVLKINDLIYQTRPANSMQDVDRKGVCYKKAYYSKDNRTLLVGNDSITYLYSFGTSNGGYSSNTFKGTKIK